MTTTAFHALSALWHDAALPADALDRVSLQGDDPLLPSSFRVGSAAQAAIAASALAAAELGALRGGAVQQASVDMLHALAACRSERLLRVDGHPPPDPWDALAGLYHTGDDSWVRLHTNFPHHRDGVLRLLACANERAAVAAALQRWEALAFEEAAAQAGLCVAALRSFEDWDAHPQARALARQPLVALTRLDDTPARPLPPLGRRDPPLQGLRVLELTRVIAGPVAGRTLAAHGAEVLLVTAEHLPAIDALVIDTGRGKRSARIDLRTESGREALRTLVREADVFLQSYRPGALAALGFDAQSLAALRPGIVVASLSAYGPEGPWSARRGFDSLVQTATGFNQAEGEAAGRAQPQPLPAQILDHASGYLLAFGIQAALMRRARQGGSWHVQVSLARTGHWLRSLGRVPDGCSAPEPAPEQLEGVMESSDSGFGTLHAVRHPGRLSVTPPSFGRPAVPLGTDVPAWEASGSSLPYR